MIILITLFNQFARTVHVLIQGNFGKFLLLLMTNCYETLVAGSKIIII